MILTSQYDIIAILHIVKSRLTKKNLMLIKMLNLVLYWGENE